jgi:hypothetical protein
MCSVLFTRKLGRQATGHVAFLSAAAVLAIAVGAWFAWVPVAQAALHHPGSVALGALDDFLAATFVGGLVGTFFSLIPVRGLTGFKIRQWNPRAWLGLYFAVLFTLVQVLLRPSTSASAPVTHAPLVGTVVAFFVAAAASVAFFEHFERKKRPAGSASPSLQERLHALMAAARGNPTRTDDEPEGDGAASDRQEGPDRREGPGADDPGPEAPAVDDAREPAVIGSTAPRSDEGEAPQRAGSS